MLQLDNFNNDDYSEIKNNKIINKEDTINNVKAGYQYLNVGDFEINESVAGSLKYGQEIYVSITDGVSSDIAIMPGYKWEITNGDIKIKDVKNSSNLSANGHRSSSPHIGFKIDRESTKPSTIKFSNVHVKVDGKAPISNTESGGYQVVIWGPGIANNYKGLIDNNTNDNDYFETPGIGDKYINVETGADQSKPNINNSVQMSFDDSIIKINDSEQKLDIAPYISEKNNSMMVPLRYVSYALGLPEDSVKWDAETSTVTVDAGSRIIQMKINDSMMKINGINVPMLSKDGYRVNAEIKNDRVFIPFRNLAEALDIKVDWDEQTKTATYNSYGLD